MIRRNLRVLTAIGKPQAGSQRPYDRWDLMNAAAGAQGEFWYHLLLGR